MAFNFLLSFLLLVAMGALIINGWFMVTRGEWGKYPNGADKKNGMILKGWWFFWFKHRGPDCRMLLSDPFYEMALRLQQDSRLSNFRIRIPNFRDNDTPHIVADKSLALDRVAQVILKKEYDVIATRLYIGDREQVETMDAYYNLFDIDKDYVFPEKIRTVMAGCITCHASVYGTAIYATFVWLVGFPWFASVSQRPVSLIFATWIAYMLSLAYVNTRLWAKRNG